MLTNHLFSIVMCLNSVLNVKALAGPFNQEKALVGAFSVIVKLRVISGNLRLKLWLLRRCCVNMTAEGGGGGVVTHGTRATPPQHHRTTAAALSAGNTGHWSDVVTRFRSLHHDAQCAHHRRFSHRYMVHVLHFFLSFHIRNYATNFSISR